MTINQKKTLTTEAVADVYLAALYKLEKKGERKFLNEILDNNNIQYNQVTLNNVIKVLLERRFIKWKLGKCVFSLNEKKTDSKKAQIRKGETYIKSLFTPDFFKSLDSSVGLYELTIEGKAFVLSGQVIDDEKKVRRGRYLHMLIFFVLRLISHAIEFKIYVEIKLQLTLELLLNLNTYF
jgi:hypothetical protein